MNIIEAIFWLTITTYFEARGETPAGQRAVCKVILNRAKSKGWQVKDIVAARKQFSCYHQGLAALKIADLPSLVAIHANVQQALVEWQAGDTIQGATHYYAIKAMVGNKPPYWASSMQFVTEIQGHRFLREV